MGLGVFCVFPSMFCTSVARRGDGIHISDDPTRVPSIGVTRFGRFFCFGCQAPRLSKGCWVALAEARAADATRDAAKATTWHLAGVGPCGWAERSHIALWQMQAE